MLLGRKRENEHLDAAAGTSNNDQCELCVVPQIPKTEILCLAIYESFYALIAVQMNSYYFILFFNVKNAKSAFLCVFSLKNI